jgi:hypothetical protein
VDTSGDVDIELEVRDGFRSCDKMLKQTQYPRDREARKSDDKVMKAILQTVEVLHLGLHNTARHVVGCQERQ